MTPVVLDHSNDGDSYALHVPAALWRRLTTELTTSGFAIAPAPHADDNRTYLLAPGPRQAALSRLAAQVRAADPGHRG